MAETDPVAAGASAAGAAVPLPSSRPASADELYEYLAGLGIDQRTVEHPPVFTVEEAKALRGSLPGGHVKNLFLRNKKGAMWLVVAEEDRPIDLKALGEAIGAGRVSFGSPERLMAHLGVIPGAVTPLALVNDRERLVQPVIDEGLLAHELVNVHPLRNDRTTTITTRDLLRFVAALGYEARVMGLPG
ncbi:MAG: prolyl-tRNA synthetase associated domain-containing protein [Dongiaceae bacterium]